MECLPLSSFYRTKAPQEEEDDRKGSQCAEVPDASEKEAGSRECVRSPVGNQFAIAKEYAERGATKEADNSLHCV